MPETDVPALTRAAAAGRRTSAGRARAADTALAPLDVDALRVAADRASALMKALANPDRLLLLCQLAQGELSVGELEERLGIRQPTLSQQLAVLRAEGLVGTRRDGRRIHYRLASPAAADVMGVLYRHFCAPAAP